MKIKKNVNFKVGVIILAAGMGKRMHSNIPKVLIKAAGIPILLRILRQVQIALPEASIALVVGSARREIENQLNLDSGIDLKKIQWIDQENPLGTGHAVRCALESEWANQTQCTHYLILPGDAPLLTSDLIVQMTQNLPSSFDCRMLSCILDDPTGYGRVKRQGQSLSIVEEKEASEQDRKISEVVTSIYLFSETFLLKALKKVKPSPAGKEYYLTSVFDEHEGLSLPAIEVLIWKNSDDPRGVNNLWELGQASELLNLRVIKKWALMGVYFEDLKSVEIGDEVILEASTVISRGAILRGQTVVKKGSFVGPNVHLRNVLVGEGVILKIGTVAEDSVIENGAVLGPYAHLRPQSRVGSRVKIGNFVELKNTQVSENTSISHLSYLGDATVGKNVNIGCGFITCNFDGRVTHGKRKHLTVIEDDVFLGSDCQAIAPIHIGRGAYIASGSTLTEDVEPDALAIARSRQVTKKGYAKKLRD